MSRVSIIIPTHDRPKQLARCLEALGRLEFDHRDFEVIVVDDGSPEPLERRLLEHADGLDLTIVHQPQRGPGAARNVGAAAAKGALLAFIDDDCRPAPDWLGELMAKHSWAPERLIGGRTLNRLPRNPYATASQVIVDVAYAHYNRDPDDAGFFASNNLAIPAGLYRQIGGFDEAFRLASEDRDLCDRWLRRGHRMIYAARAVVFHGRELTFFAFCRQHFNYGRGACRFHRARARRGSGTLQSEVRFHFRFLALLRAPLSRLGPRKMLAVCFLLPVWQLANAAGYFFEVSRPSSTRPPRPA